MQRYSLVNVFGRALRANTGWGPAWRTPTLRQGNSGRNTQVTRSNYFYPVSSSFFDHSLRLYEGLSRELNFNVMLRQDGVINLGHSLHELEIQRRSRAFRFSAVCSSAGRGSPVTMRWCGGLRGVQVPTASTSFKAAK